MGRLRIKRPELDGYLQDMIILAQEKGDMLAEDDGDLRDIAYERGRLAALRDVRFRFFDTYEYEPGRRP